MMELSMDENIVKVAIAAFLHDIGDMVDAEVLPLSEEFKRNHSGLCPKWDSGRDLDLRPMYTAAIIEAMEKQELLPRKLGQAHWELTDGLLELSAGGHNPQSPLQWIIAIADGLSRGWDIDQIETEGSAASKTADFRKSGLLPIFEHLLAKDPEAGAHPVNYTWRYPLKEVSPRNIFPLQTSSSEDKTLPERNRLFKKFMQGLGKLAHKEQNLSLWFEHFESLVMATASLLPAASSTVADISLYDHLRVTAALAAALYAYHKSTGTLAPADIPLIKDYSGQKFLIIGGDFYGIQSFIFSDSGEARKNRSKILRGRSFAVSLFSELAADMLCRRIGIPSICVVLNTAGKFIIIAPNTEQTMQAMKEVESQVNEWLISISYGEMAIGMDSLEASPVDFARGNFLALWEKLSEKMAFRKCRKIDLNRFGGTVEGYLNGFNDKLEHSLCPFCGKRPSSESVEGANLIGDAKSSCRICRDHIFLGTKLVKKVRLAITAKEAVIYGGDEAKLSEPIFGEYQVAFIDGGLNEMARTGELMKYWDVFVDPEGEVFRDVTVRFINGSVPACTQETLEDRRLTGRSGKKKEELTDESNIGAPKTFEHIACMALSPNEQGEGYLGIEALGVLKADVDQLGMLMSCGLKPERFTLARLATLSRQVNWYFALYLPHLLKVTPHFNDIYTVFAGGDDLFLIGPWNRVVDLAAELHSTFAEYVCKNREIHFSAGITLHKTHTPLDKLAHQAEAALSRSKDEGRDRVTLFSETIKWSSFLELQEIKHQLQEWRDSNLVNNAMLYRLDQFIGMAEEEYHLIKQAEIKIEQMQCLKWHSFFHYMADRNIGKVIKADSREERARIKAQMIDQFSRAAGWLETYRAGFKIALWDVIYNQRKGA